MKKNRRIVVKIGTKVITSKERMLDTERLKDLVGQVSAIRGNGSDVIIVTSGAIGAGMSLLGLKKRPAELAELQAAASIGQSHLMHLYSGYFRSRGYLVGQILLTQDDFNDRKRYLNIRYTIQKLLCNNAIPVINENDTISTDEIRCGDNDRLAGLVSDLCQADMLILLTDVDGLLDEDCNLVREVDALTPRVSKLARSSQCDLGTGGMATKLEAVRRVTSAGIECVIANGKKKEVLLRILAGDNPGTVFKSGSVKHQARKRWIAYSSRPKGALIIDSGARSALADSGKSLLASGIVEVEGDFARGDVVRVLDREGRELGRGVVSYPSLDVLKIKGHKASEIKGILGHKEEDEVIHKDDLVIL